MRKKLVIFLIILGFNAMVFSACNSDWDGEITITGGTKLPNYIHCVTWYDYQNNPGIDGIDIIGVNPKTPKEADYIIRIKTYNSLADILTGQCNCAKPCILINPDENEVNKLLEKFDHNFFETKNLIVTKLTGGVLTMNFQVSNISKNGVINITETQRIGFLPVIDMGVYATLAIEIDSSFITPPIMTVSVKLN